MTIKMYRDDCSRLRRQEHFKLSAVHGIGCWIDIDKDRDCTYQRNRLYRRDKGVGYSDHFVTRTNITSFQCQGERICTCCYTDAILTFTIFRKLTFKSLDLRPKKKLHVLQHIL